MSDKLNPSTQPQTLSVNHSLYHDPSSLQMALGELLKSRVLADDANRSEWDFAVEIKTLWHHGLSEADFRWLVCKGLVAHACEVTRDEDERRRFRPVNNLKFKKRSCFVLTDAGRAFTRHLLDRGTYQRTAIKPQLIEKPSPQIHPRWDGERHELYVAEFLVKRFRWVARNQEAVLAALEEENWPSVGIDDPLAPHEDKDPKQRLRDTIKCLNRYQQHRFIRFRGDGTGERVLWEFTAKAVKIISSLYPGSKLSSPGQSATS